MARVGVHGGRRCLRSVVCAVGKEADWWARSSLQILIRKDFISMKPTSKKAKLATEKHGSDLIELCRGFIKGLNGIFRACARKCSLVFIKVGKICLYLRCSCCLWGEGCQNRPHLLEKRSRCHAELSQCWPSREVLMVVLLDCWAIPCPTAPLKHAFDTIPPSSLSRSSLLPGQVLVPPRGLVLLPSPPSLTAVLWILWAPAHQPPFHSWGKAS